MRATIDPRSAAAALAQFAMWKRHDDEGGVGGGGGGGDDADGRGPRSRERERERRGCLCVTDSARLAAAADDGEMEKVSGRTAGKEEEEEE